MELSSRGASAIRFRLPDVLPGSEHDFDPWLTAALPGRNNRTFFVFQLLRGVTRISESTVILVSRGLLMSTYRVSIVQFNFKLGALRRELGVKVWNQLALGTMFEALNMISKNYKSRRMHAYQRLDIGV